jgi:hypothetical protein
MEKQLYALAVGWNGETFEAAIPALHLTETGTTHEEVLIKALEAMDRLEVVKLKTARKRRLRTQKRTVA